MPAKSAKQQRFMGMCSNPEGRKKARGKCPPVSVAKEFAHKAKKTNGSKKTKARKR